jgi:hypothetical protein
VCKKKKEFSFIENQSTFTTFLCLFTLTQCSCLSHLSYLLTHGSPVAAVEEEDAELIKLTQSDKAGFVPDDLIDDSVGSTPTLAGRLKARISEWRKITTNVFILSIILNGYRIEWDPEKGPPPRCDEKNHQSAMLHEQATDDAIEAGVKMDVMREISEADAHNIMPIHMDERKKDGKKRFCHDCRFINYFIKDKKFKMESLNKEGRSLFADCTVGWLIDLSHAYYHIQVDPKYWKYLCFRWKGKVYCFTVLPFGITSAPRIFTTVL